MTTLHQLFDEQGQSPWLDGVARSYLLSGRLGDHVDAGVRGVATTAAILEQPVPNASNYDTRIRSLVKANLGIEDIHWELVIEDVTSALAALLPVYENSGGMDGFVSFALPPGLGQDVAGTVLSARSLHQQIDSPNLLIAVPATEAGISAIQAITSEALGTNAKRVFSLKRYEQVIDAYMSGLETCPGDLSSVHSVASFFLGEIDERVDDYLRRIGGPAALELTGQAASCQAKCAYRVFQNYFSSPRWEALADRGANVQRPLWISSTRSDGAHPDTFYVDALIGPNTVTAMSVATLTGFQDHGTLRRTIDSDVERAISVLARLRGLGIDLADLSRGLEKDGLTAVTRSYEATLAALRTRATLLSS